MASPAVHDPDASIKKLELVNYKGFSRFTAHFSGSTYLVGPNNAGKSTLIQALRGCAHMIDHAYVKAPSGNRRDGDKWFRVYPFPKDEFSLVTENVRHEFSPAETRLELLFSNGNKLNVVWPQKNDTDEGEVGAFFYLQSRDGKEPTRPKDVKELFPRIGIIPTLMPIDHSEQVLQEKYVRQHMDGRLASRHFRNNVYLLQSGGEDGPFESYREFVKNWTPEITLTELKARMGVSSRELDLFYRETLSRTDKEVYWAGDGLQIWLQFLLHMHRLDGAPVIILDEPDVYLHADLQRRLVRMLKKCGAQTIAATHSLEIVGEAGPGTITLVDRTRRKTIRAPGEEMLAHVSDTIGSQFNMRLARALRAKAVVFVEGKDIKLLRHLAARVGAESFAAEHQVAVIPLEGFSNWENVIPFQWLIEELLAKSVSVFVILDRDYRLDEDLVHVKKRLEEKGVAPLIWKRKELESYLLEVGPLRRLTGAPEPWLKEKLSEIIAGLETFVHARVHERWVRQGLRKDQHLVTVTERELDAFRVAWSKVEDRIRIVPPKEVLSRLNEALQAAGYKATSFPVIARTIRDNELPAEVGSNLRQIERAITSGTSAASSQMS